MIIGNTVTLMFQNFHLSASCRIFPFLLFLLSSPRERQNPQDDKFPFFLLINDIKSDRQMEIWWF